MSTATSAAYDANFLFPVRDVESNRVKLTLFTPGYAAEFLDGVKDHPELYKYFPPGPYTTLGELCDEFLETLVHKDPLRVVYAVLDKKDGKETLAGMIGLLAADVVNQSTEIGYVMTFPKYQHSYTTSNAIGLLLHYCLELPVTGGAEAAAQAQPVSKHRYGPGLGLRRVQWQCHSENAASKRAAERMGFRFEGMMRWQRVLREGKDGFAVPEDRAKVSNGPGRHSLMFSICWDDWELEGVREHVQNIGGPKSPSLPITSYHFCPSVTQSKSNGP